MKLIQLIISIAALFYASQARAELSADQVAQKAYDVEDGQDLEAHLVMTITKDGDAKTRQLSFARKDFGKDSKVLFKFTAPALVQGTSFISWSRVQGDNDYWIYLPALKKVRRIASSDKSQSFMGSDYSYEDLSKRSLSKDSFSLRGKENVDKASCYILQAVAKDKGEEIVRRVAWIRQDNFLIAKAEFYDRSGKLKKRLANSQLKRVQNIWTVMFSQMEDVQNKSRSTLALSGVRYNTRVPDRLFNPESLK